ncbi:MAG TPA: DUF4864 domain-containing protein [Chthoniobacterales bacterium]|nr:DUF4864 domain-containing protein [Chthoniobacterales bacterium]
MTRTIKGSLLFCVFALCAAAMVVTQRARQHVPSPAPHQLFAIVEQQLSAFRSADYSSAYWQASSDVQQKFTPPQYEAMIRRDYADVAGAQRIEFGFVKVSGVSALVQVFFRDADGSIHAFLYSFIAEGDAWKINGVQPMEPTPRGLHI